MYLRPYQSADLDALYGLDRVCFAPPFRFSRAMMRQVVGEPGAVVLLACETAADETESVLGFCVVQMDGADAVVKAGYVSTLDVAHGARGRGVGRMLMLAVEEQVMRAGGFCVLLHVFVGNEPAVRLYERLGYQCVGQEQDFYAPGLDAWAYRKELSTAAPASAP